MSTIKITKPYLLEKGIYIYIYTKLILSDGRTYDLWYSVEKEYKEFVSIERSDAFVVNILLYAMEHKLDIECEEKISEKLYYQLTEYLIPSISRNVRKYHEIRIFADLTDDCLESVNAVGGSLSGGVDSFYTLLRHLDRKERSYNITHLTFFNAGASGQYGGEKARERYLSRIDFIKDVADSLGKKLVCIDTNINEFLGQNHQATHSFRTLAIPLLLQKLFSKYYFASGMQFKKFCFLEKDCASYDLLNVQCFSTENLQFYSSGGEVSRLEKVKFISDFDVTYSKLNVCIFEDINCSRCEKCRRTMMELYALGRLGKYKSVFDLNYFEKNKKSYWRSLEIYKDRDDWKDIYDLLSNSVNLSIIDKIKIFRKNLSDKISIRSKVREFVKNFK